MKNDDLGNRMKDYERTRTSEKLSGPFVYARIDGRGFSKFTRGLDKPFDIGLSATMQLVTEKLVQKTHAIAGYTQSDEISLFWDREKIFFEGKIQKLSSVLASLTTAHFIIDGKGSIPDEYLENRYPHFDARIFDLPSVDEVANAFYWRYKDAYRNSISMIGQANFSHKSLNNKNQKEVKHMLAEIGVFENDFSDNHIHGTFVTRKTQIFNSEIGAYTRDKVVSSSGKLFSTLDHADRVYFLFGENSDLKDLI